MSQREPHEPPSAASDSESGREAGKRRSVGGNPLRWIVLYTRGLIADQHLRRLTMFYAVIAAMLMVFVGDAFLRDWLDHHKHLARFAVYWLICGWLTVLAALLAIYDLILLRLQARLLRRELHARFLEREIERERERKADDR